MYWLIVFISYKLGKITQNLIEIWLKSSNNNSVVFMPRFRTIKSDRIFESNFFFNFILTFGLHTYFKSQVLMLLQCLVNNHIR